MKVTLAYKPDFDHGSELELVIGETVTWLEDGSEGWVLVQRSNGQQGWAPADFLKTL